ncbi:MAG: NlpC/P60 family protein [Lachnospiraceae bacterium]|nr:NlpC/P60 family protein [Lachnospiraceae bacterium]
MKFLKKNILKKELNVTNGLLVGVCITMLTYFWGIDVYAASQGLITAGVAKFIEQDSSDVTIGEDVESEEINEKSVSAPEVEETESQETIAGYTNLGIANVENHLNVREEPLEDGKLVGKMTKNAGCEILSVDGDWAKIKSGKVEGYVNTEFLYMGEEAKEKAAECIRSMATVNTTTLFVREQPSTDSSVITMVPLGEELEVVEDSEEWCKIEIDDEEGYINKEYVDIAEELDKAVTLEELRYGEGVSDVRISMVAFAKQFLGNSYVWGGTSLTNGTDCSGFTMGVYKEFGISLPRVSRSQATVGTKISASELKPGDLVFYGKGGTINHVALYIGNGQVIHASSRKTGIKISNVYYRTPLAIRRIIND